MKTRKLFLGFAAMLAASTTFTSCSNEDELGARPTDGRTPITLTSNIATRTVNTQLQETDIAQGVQVGVFVTPTAAGELIADNAVITSDGKGSFTGTIGNYPTGEGATVGIYAYAPYNSAWTGKLNEAQTFTVKTDQTADADYLASDLLYGTPQNNAVAASENAVQVQFKHKLTKINLAFNTEGTEIDLKGATVSLVDVLTQTTINLSDGTLGTSTATADITVAKFAADATQFAASAIIVPQTVSANADFVRVQLADGTTYDANISTNFTFETGKQYTYTATFTENGLELKLRSTIEGWQDGVEKPSGDTEEKIVYGVGDYITSDGTFIKNSELSDDNKADVVAVIVSTQVSTDDAEDGYDAYAMGLTVAGSKGWGFTDLVVKPSVTTFAAALADLDGRSKTSTILESTAYENVADEDKDGTVFEYCVRSSNKSPIGAAGSDWFVPSIGQMIQMLNNLGGAGITSSTAVHESNTSSPIYYTTSEDAITKINAYATAVGKTEFIKASSIYVTVTESDANFWCLQTNPTVSNDDTAYAWGFGRNPGKGNNNRNLIPFVAVKLPAETSSAAE